MNESLPTFSDAHQIRVFRSTSLQYAYLNHNSSFCISHSEPRFHHSAFKILHSPFGTSLSSFCIPHSAFRIPNPAFIILHSKFCILHSVLHFHHSAFCIPNSAFRSPHSVLRIPFSAFSIQPFPLPRALVCAVLPIAVSRPISSFTSLVWLSNTLLLIRSTRCNNLSQ